MTADDLRVSAKTADEEVQRARPLVFRGLVTGLSPRLLAVPTRIDHCVGQDAITWSVREAQAAALSPAD